MAWVDLNHLRCLTGRGSGIITSGSDRSKGLGQVDGEGRRFELIASGATVPKKDQAPFSR